MPDSIRSKIGMPGTALGRWGLAGTIAGLVVLSCASVDVPTNDESVEQSSVALGKGKPGGGGSGRCGAGYNSCRGVCVDLQTNPDNCGACATVCSAGTCQQGLCCPTGTTNCGGTCGDLQTSSANCGTCGNACVGGTICSTGLCKPGLHIIVSVKNDNQGTKTARDVSVSVSNNGVLLEPPPGDYYFHADADGRIDVPLDPGRYNVNAVPLAGYGNVYSGACDDPIAIGESKTCGLQFDDLAPP